MTTYPPPPQCVNDCANCGAWSRRSYNRGGDETDRLFFWTRLTIFISRFSTFEQIQKYKHTNTKIQIHKYKYNTGGDDADQLSFWARLTKATFTLSGGWASLCALHFWDKTGSGGGEGEGQDRSKKVGGGSADQKRGKGAKKSPATLQRALWRWSIVTHTYASDQVARNAKLFLNLSRSNDTGVRDLCLYLQPQHLIFFRWHLSFSS